MYTGLLHLHSILRYFILALLVVVVVLALIGLLNKKAYGKTDNKLSLFLFILTHTQLLVGIILYIVSYTGGHRVQFNSETMSTPALRYFAVEHFLMMLIAIVLITLGRTRAKKAVTDLAKHKLILIFNGIALLIILGTIYGMGRAYNTL
jgi:uncharacterized membrane protein